MAKLVIRSGNQFLDGEYELDLSQGFNFTKTEWFLMKRKVGVVVDDMRPGAPLDMSVMTGLGLVALHRAGKEHLLDTFMETTDDQTDWVWAAGEVADTDDVDPQIGSGSSASAEMKNGSSGPSTGSDSEPSPAAGHPATGDPGSATTAVSAQETSEA